MDPNNVRHLLHKARLQRGSKAIEGKNIKQKYGPADAKLKSRNDQSRIIGGNEQGNGKQRDAANIVSVNNLRNENNKRGQGEGDQDAKNLDKKRKKEHIAHGGERAKKPKHANKDKYDQGHPVSDMHVKKNYADELEEMGENGTEQGINDDNALPSRSFDSNITEPSKIDKDREVKNGDESNEQDTDILGNLPSLEEIELDQKLQRLQQEIEKESKGEDIQSENGKEREKEFTTIEEAIELGKAIDKDEWEQQERESKLTIKEQMETEQQIWEAKASKLKELREIVGHLVELNVAIEQEEKEKMENSTKIHENKRPTTNGESEGESESESESESEGEIGEAEMLEIEDQLMKW
ncbi:hypothetical protein AX774_g2814 [Zancudomyces culisetae]|uniref:Uncharacterized protein n=1 Tax=Zancudomyces culisetae TaxID=1213189 RepID=A0A1R1PS07_ZANCU|nr:hypothetical protein AX774_g2814 [Zancudomyces culisetae]|eukprot:OMH83673.1 hypothetical protein AX774_g2814 [Zancudomyces culisetae]